MTWHDHQLSDADLEGGKPGGEVFVDNKECRAKTKFQVVLQPNV